MSSIRVRVDNDRNVIVSGAENYGYAFEAADMYLTNNKLWDGGEENVNALFEGFKMFPSFDPLTIYTVAY